MAIDIARVFSQSWEMIKERWLLLLGMWLAFFVINIVYTMVGGGVIGGSMFALGAAAAGGLGDSEMLMGGLGIGGVLMLIVFYIGSIVIIFAQQCAMAALATPLRRTPFGEAIGIGLKAGVTFIAIAILLAIAYLVFGIAYMLVAVVLSLLGSVGAILSVLLLIPVLLYFAVRLSVIVPVVAVDGTLNPIKAISRTWSMTSGNALPILAVYAVIIGIALILMITAYTARIIGIALILLGLPFFLMFGSLFAAEAGAGDAAAVAAVGSMIGGFFLLVPMFLIYSIIAIVINTCLHAQMTDTQTDEVAETFA